MKSTSVCLKCRVDTGSVEKLGCAGKRFPIMSHPVSHGKKPGLYQWEYGGPIEGFSKKKIY